MLDNLKIGSGYILNLVENGEEEVVYTVYKGKNVLGMHIFHDAFKTKKAYQFDEHVLRGATFEVGNYPTSTGFAELKSIQLI